MSYNNLKQIYLETLLTGNNMLNKHLLRSIENNDDVNIIKSLLDQGADVNAKWDNNNSSLTMLMRAVLWNNVETVELLLKYGADVNAKTDTGFTALLCSGSNKMTKLLLNYGANVNDADYTGKTALMKAAELGNLSLIKLLIDNNADINAQDNDGNTAFDYVMNSSSLVISDENKKAAIRLLNQNEADKYFDEV